MTYPSGRSVTTCYDRNGRVTWIDPTLSTVQCQGGAEASASKYADVSGYWPQGAVHTLTLGNGLTETTGYNNRLQMTSLTAGSLLTLGLSYCPNGAASCASNNGNLLRQTMSRPKSADGQPLVSQQDYGYDDPLNRLTSVVETVTGGLPAEVTAGNWSSAFRYDGFGNVAGTSTLPVAGMASATTQYNPATNRLWQRPNGAALPSDAYDDAGNLHNHPDLGQMTYDAQNRLAQYSFNGGGEVSFVYDGEGRRVQKTAGGGTTTYVYDGFGQLAAEYGGSITQTGRRYLTADHLGSTRLVTGGPTDPPERLDYHPFGVTLAGTQLEGNRDLVAGYGVGSSGPPIKFTGKERDGETGLDYFGARYFSGAQGRFTSPDWSETPEPVPYADLADPQTLNLYSYVRNNPLSKADADGHCYPLCTVAGGALLGGLTGGGAELIHQSFSGAKLDWGKIGHAAAGGAVAGAIAGLAGPEAGLAAKVAISAGGSIIGGAAERGLHGEAVVNPTAIAIDVVGGVAGAAAENAVSKLLPAVAPGMTVSEGAGRSFTATVRTEAGAAAENTARNTVRTTTTGVAQTVSGAAGNAAKTVLQPPPPPRPPAPPKPPRDPNQN